MKTFWVVFITLASSILLLYSCQDTDKPEESFNKSSDKTKPAEFKNPAHKIIRIDSDEKSLINNKKYTHLLKKANNLSVDIQKARQYFEQENNDLRINIEQMVLYNAQEIFTSIVHPYDKIIVSNPVFNSYITNSHTLNIALANDLFNNIDRYYTNGIIVKYQTPAFAFWRINSILPVSVKNSVEYNSLEIHHAMYTPYSTKSPPPLKDDRPYSSTLLVRFVRMSENPGKGIIQKASFDIGVIGQAALGSLMQEGVHATLPHNDEPLGWETQIANDLILNYNYEFVRKLFSVGGLHSYYQTNFSIGTLVTDFSAGLGFKFGTDKYFISPLPDNLKDVNLISLNKLNFSFQTNFNTTVVGYNATLNGGLLNKNNIFVLEPHEIERLIFKADAKLSISYRNYGINLAQYFITNEFKKGKNHSWGQIGLNFEF
ncbi:MAG TPA: lipid A deacylase LpxR family protein [Lentimicrobium sp.]|nr:lipid A deacylase LpxR family protein [Lentimicrobium sp.]